MTTVRRKFSAREKVRILRLHLLEGKPISEICELYQPDPTVFYRWQKELFEHATAASEWAGNGATDRMGQGLQKENAQLKSKLAAKDEVIGEIMAEQVRLKKHLVWAERRLGSMTHMRTRPYYPNRPVKEVSGKITYLLRLLRGHKIICRLPNTRRYRLRPGGAKIIATILLTQHAVTEQLNTAAG